MAKEKSKRRNAAEEGQKLADLLPKPRAASDFDVFLAGGMKALKEKFIRDEGPELMNKATIFGLGMTQVATIVSAVKGKLSSEIDWNEVEPAVLKDAVNQLLEPNKSPKH